MLVLALDTSSAAVTAAVVDVSADVRVLAERITVNARGHGELLAPSIEACLDEARLAPKDLGAVVAGVGPGPFTGLRVGLVTAAVMGELLSIPTYGVCSLDAIGHELADEDALLVATDARRKEVYWARYRRGIRVSEPEVSKPADVPLDAITATSGAGAVLHDFGVRMRDVRYPGPADLVACAVDRIGEGAPSETLTPMYLRRPDAVANPIVKPVSQ